MAHNGRFTTNAVISAMAMIFATEAHSNDFYYTIGPDSTTAAHYPTPDAACQDYYKYDLTLGPPQPIFVVPQPYQPPKVLLDFPPKTLVFSCNVEWQTAEGDGLTSRGEVIYRNGDQCTEAQSYNPVTGICEASSEEQQRKELGDETAPANVGIVTCGDPVNPANGNVFERETDYVDPDGGLTFQRSYNSGGLAPWSTTFDTRLYFDNAVISRGTVVLLPDGRSALFVNIGGTLVPDGGELGSLTNVGGVWTYASPDGERFIFNGAGDLTRWESGDGKSFDVVKEGNALDAVLTATDWLGHKLIYTTHFGYPSKLEVGDLTVTYVIDASFRLSGLTRTRGGMASTRKYLYEDPAHPKSLTGITDERGVRAATWRYDAQNRAVSVAGAGGKNAYAFAYDSSTQTTVTNPLGHLSRYSFAVVQGVKRITSIDGEPAPGCPAANSKFSYDPVTARLVARTDARGYRTVFTYDAQGREISRTEGKGAADERTTTTSWEGASARRQTVTTVDRKTTYSYDGQGRLQSVSIHSLKD